MFAKTESYFEGLPRRAFPIERLRSQSFQEDTNYPVARHCVFFGSQDDSGEVPAAPELKFDKRPKKNAA